jgi:diketogulonate reductase-like aldo/keto reductase
MMNAEPFLLSACQVRMPRLIYGTAWKKAQTAEWVELAIRCGFRGIDTACQPKHYNEAGVGDGIAACIKTGIISRDSLYLQSKFTPLNGQDPLRIPYDAKATLAQQVAQSFQCSLQNLQTDYLDGLILHSPLAKQSQLMEVWQAMEQLFFSGGCKQLGISNCYDLDTLRFLYQGAKVKPAILQNRFYADSGYDTALRDFCQRQGIIYQSFWTLTANPRILASSEVKALAKKYQRTVAQVFFRYLTQQGIMPLTGTTSEQHIREDLAIFEFELADAECVAIGALLL